MWSGRVVPLIKPLHEPSLVYKPQATQGSLELREQTRESASVFDTEELQMLLPEDLCFGTGIRNGSSVYVGYQWNPPLVFRTHYDVQNLEEGREKESLKRWLDQYSSDVAAWIIISPFPIELLPTRIMHLIVRLANRPGAFHNAVTIRCMILVGISF